MSVLSVSIIVGVGFALLFRALKAKAQRKAASYQLYAVRDELICLVAEGKLKEDGDVFRYYYKRVNNILMLAPDVGLDNAIEAMFYIKTCRNKKLERKLEAANREVEKILQKVKNEDESVSMVIADFYAAMRSMILAHSSFSRLIYIVLRYTPKLIVARLPDKARVRFKVVNFTSHEEEKFRQLAHSG